MASAGDGGEGPVEVHKKANWAMMELSNMIAVPMSLYAVVRLNVPAAIWQSGTNFPLSAAEILPLLHPPPPPSADPANLQRLLRLLASHGVFTEHLSPSGVRRFSLTPVGQTLVPAASSNGGGGGDGSSYAPYVLQHHQEALLRAWPLLHEAVLDGAGPEPFARANGGTPAHIYYGDDGEANELMQRSMWGVSKSLIDAIFDGYAAAFAGVGTLVDVGGSSGDCLRAIMQRVPTIRRGVNFDLPPVVAKAPNFPGE